MVEIKAQRQKDDELIEIVTRESAAAAIEEDAANKVAEEANAYYASAQATRDAANRELERDAIPAM